MGEGPSSSEAVVEGTGEGRSGQLKEDGLLDLMEGVVREGILKKDPHISELRSWVNGRQEGRRPRGEEEEFRFGHKRSELACGPAVWRH